jgi:hypothetical protein
MWRNQAHLIARDVPERKKEGVSIPGSKKKSHSVARVPNAKLDGVSPKSKSVKE